MRVAIAEEWVIFEHRDGTRRAGAIRIEQPYVDDEGEAHCGVVIDGLFEKMPDIRGRSPLRALLLAVSFCASLLRDFVHDGGRILRPANDGSVDGNRDFDIDECFGPLASGASAPSSRRRHAQAH